MNEHSASLFAIFGLIFIISLIIYWKISDLKKETFIGLQKKTSSARREAFEKIDQLAALGNEYNVEEFVEYFQKEIFRDSFNCSGANLIEKYEYINDFIDAYFLNDPGAVLRKKNHDPLDDSVLFDPVDLLLQHPMVGPMAVRVNRHNCDLFLKVVDASAVYVNASTAFTDGGQFGLGAEIGISTQKLHARGPMALEELTSYKWLVEGTGQIRS